MTKRIDLVLVEKCLVPSRQKAQSLIAEGAVLVDGRPVKKPSERVGEEQEIRITQGLRYVGRGGLKLERALRAFHINLQGLICADIGASTGGFTDCMLQSGARKVYAIDSGHGQLDPSLAQHPEVINLEGCNIRDFSPDAIEPLDFAAADLSFISLTLVLSPIRKLMKDKSSAVFLVKPQFEAGREYVGKGVIHNPKVHQRVLEKILNAAREAGFQPLGLEPSPILGGDGNVEFLLFTQTESNRPEVGFNLTELVSRAWKAKQRTRKEAEPDENRNDGDATPVTTD